MCAVKFWKNEKVRNWYDYELPQYASVAMIIGAVVCAFDANWLWAYFLVALAIWALQ